MDLQKVKVNYETPKTHVWEIYGVEKSFAWLLNKETGKVYGLDAERRARVKLRTIDKRKIASRLSPFFKYKD